MSTDSHSDCEDQNPKHETLSANIHEDHQLRTLSYADALKGPQSPKAKPLPRDIDNESQSSKTASVSRDAKDEPQSPKAKPLPRDIDNENESQSSKTASVSGDARDAKDQEPQSPKAKPLPGDIDNESQSSKTTSVSRGTKDEPQSPQSPKRSANVISFHSRRHINPWIATLQYRVSALVYSIEIAQANALPFRNHADLGEPLPFVMDRNFSALLVRSNMRLVAEWIRELQMKGLSVCVELEGIVNRLYFFSRAWSLRNHDCILLWRIQLLVSDLVPEDVFT
jgi:hypothetical protein